MPVSTSDFVKALEIGRPPNVVKLFPNSKALIVSGKVIDRAKGILMKSKGLSEEEAHALLRKTAMSESRRVAEVAQGLILAAKLLG